MAKAKSFFKSYALLLIFTLLVGSLSVSQQFLSRQALGSSYKGLPVAYTANEDVYLAKMKEMMEGHWFSSSAYFYEYKNLKSLVPATGEFLYTIPGLILGLDIVEIAVLNKFLFPVILFGLVYFLIYRLTSSENFNNSLIHKINAVAGAMFVTIGYDLIDLKNSWLFLTGQDHSTHVFLWVRPVNPIVGAVLLFIFLLLIWQIINKKRRFLFIPAGLVMALMAGYIFSWALSLSITVVLLIIFLAKKENKLSKDLLLTILVNFLVLAPYLYNIFSSPVLRGDKMVAARNGMVFTHDPMFNKALLFTLLFFLLCSVYEYFKNKNKLFLSEKWWLFSLSFILGGLICFNQQVITGHTIWPYHFVQFTIPISIIIGMVILFRVIKPHFFYIYYFAIIAVIFFSTFLGIAIAKSYKYNIDYYREFQRYQGVFLWLNSNAPKECVVLTREKRDELARWIPAFTHCNTYIAPGGYDLEVPLSRRWHDFFVFLRISNVNPEEVENYLKANGWLIREYFFTDWRQVLTSSSSIDGWMEDIIKKVSIDYQDFVKRNFAGELKKYRLDYILFEGDADKETKALLPQLKFIGDFDGFFLYKF